MDRATFKAILDEQLLRHFPETFAYVSKLPEQTKTAWAESFADVDPVDLSKACQMVVSGEEVIEAYQREQLASRLRQICRRFETKKYEREQSEQQLRLADRRGASMGEALANRIKAAGAGCVFGRVLERIDKEREAMPRIEFTDCDGERRERLDVVDKQRVREIVQEELRRASE